MSKDLLSSAGGTTAASVYSGMVSGTSLTGAPGATVTGADVCFVSGAGRLKNVIVHQAIASGPVAKLYDSAVPISGGPLATSGHRVLGVVSPYLVGSQATDAPFQNGLCANLLSGGPGFTVVYNLN